MRETCGALQHKYSCGLQSMTEQSSTLCPKKMALGGHFDVTQKSTEKLGNALIKAACVIHYDSFFNYQVTYYFFHRCLLPLVHRMFGGLLMSSYSVVCFIFIVPCVAQVLIYCVLLNHVLRAKSIKRLWPGDLVC